MLRRSLAAVVISGVGSLGFLACSGESPATPSALVAESQARQPQGAPGTYELGFFKVGAGGAFEPVTSLPLGGPELILGARVYVQGHPELPAQSGAVTFEYCSLKGGPANDPTRIDEAPLEACANGTGSWARLGTERVTSAGEAYKFFGVVRFTPTIGFRFRYSDQGSGVASGGSDPVNFNWT